ncbi:hypothetical protein J4Q44_G00116330 [Coregonus suidteri]|uniref:Uncharacterized protein n=1 Tax=Coregonus suidteri TaxID=861788 RepID=A0AAN8M3T5_9TELE
MLHNILRSYATILNAATGTWRQVSTIVGLPEEDCRRKWRGLRDSETLYVIYKCDHRCSETLYNVYVIHKYDHHRCSHGRG